MNTAPRKAGRLALLFLATAGTLLFSLASGCKSAKEKQMEIAAQMEIVEVDDRGYVRYRDEILKPGEFTNRVRLRQKEIEGKPVLLSVNPEVYTKQPKVVPYLRRVLERAKTGTVYDSVPEEL